jgi:hypothetical protein
MCCGFLASYIHEIVYWFYLFVIYLTTLSVAQTKASDDRMINEL